MSILFTSFVVLSAVTLLLFFVLKLKVNAFLSLLFIAIYVGILTGMPLKNLIESIKNGMGGTLGFVAVVVGLGSIFGQMLESSGGAHALAHYLLKKFGKRKASWAMMIAGFIIAIPVFFDVGFILMVPLIYALSRDTGKPLLYFSIPLLAGLAVTHSFIPPTPGPVAVADIINASLGWVIILGLIVGIPTAILAGPVFGKFISSKISVVRNMDLASLVEDKPYSDRKLPSILLVVVLIAIPLLLIVIGTVTDLLVSNQSLSENWLSNAIIFIGHPFSALIITSFSAIYMLGIRCGKSKQEVLELSTKALGPAGIIILITGAGGVLKQVLIDSGIGEIMANSVAGSSLSPIFLAWLLAAIVRVTQGSATVAMITAAGIIAPVLEIISVNEMQRALVVLSIAAGATILSHVNDSGFWLVGKYLGINEKETLQSWTVMETIIAVSGLGFCLLLNILVK
jgi:Gnt-I system low-affinity gluconate transporter